MKEKAVILLSSGLDSLTALGFYGQQYEILKAVFFNYGQKAFEKERQSAVYICDYYQLELEIIDLEFLKSTDSALTLGSAVIPEPETEDLSDFRVSKSNAEKVWVPNRNGVFLNIAAVFAEELKASAIITGFNEEEAVTFPDNSLEFMQAAEKFFSYSTKKGLKVKGLNLNKAQILQEAIKLAVPLQYLWSCYYSNEKMCGKCESCKRLKQAADILDIDLAKQGIEFQN
jgi:7-cyano-7-deazaguanine synthase